MHIYYLQKKIILSKLFTQHFFPHVLLFKKCIMDLISIVGVFILYLVRSKYNWWQFIKHIKTPQHTPNLFVKVVILSERWRRETTCRNCKPVDVSAFAKFVFNSTLNNWRLILVAAPCISSNYLIVYRLVHIHKTFSH